VLLILGALAIVLAAIWFSPRRQDTVQAKIDQGVAAQKAGRTSEAQKLYEEVLRNDPENKLANFNLGVAAHSAGDMEKAETLYVKSLQTDPDFLPALFNLAILQENTGRNEESAETYRRLLEKYPDNGAAHLNYGFLLAQKLNNPDEARAEFSKAVEINPDLAARIPADLRPAPAAAP
jgi:Tfp pilus assembly protein PilF